MVFKITRSAVSLVALTKPLIPYSCCIFNFLNSVWLDVYSVMNRAGKKLENINLSRIDHTSTMLTKSPFLKSSSIVAIFLV